MENQKRNGLLKLSICFILASTIFDFINMPFGYLWIDVHLFLKDLMYVGFALLCYIQTPFSQLKLKTLSFMLIIWRIGVIIINTAGLADNSYSLCFIYSLYAVYFLWIIRIYLINPCLVRYTGNGIQNKVQSYNIFIPVHSFRGLLKALILIHTDPRYETTILVNKKHVYHVKNKMFHRSENKPEVMERLVKKTSAMVNIKNITPMRLKKVNNLLYKTSITGMRDCQRLKI